jgi:hypothetical protein
LLPNANQRIDKLHKQIFTTLQLRYNKTMLLIDGLPLLSLSDAIEFAVPWVVVPLYWGVWVCAFRPSATPRFWRHLLPMIVATVLFTHGHGIHLSSNSLSNLFHSLAKITTTTTTTATTTTAATFSQALDLYDEFLSHLLWICGLCIFEWCIVATQITLPATNAHFATRPVVESWTPLAWYKRLACAFVGLVYGVLFFCHNIEGSTVVIGLPFCMLMIVLIIRHARLLSLSPVVIFFFASHFVTLFLFAFWYHINDGAFPEFSALKNRNFVNQFYANSESNKMEL